MKQPSRLLLVLLLLCHYTFAQHAVPLHVIKYEKIDNGHMFAQENLFFNKDTYFEKINLTTRQVSRVAKPAGSYLYPGSGICAVGNEVLFSSTDNNLYITKNENSELLLNDAVVYNTVSGKSFTLLYYAKRDGTNLRIASVNNTTHVVQELGTGNRPYSVLPMTYFEKEDKMYFAVSNGDKAVEVYITDGTVEGTRVIGTAQLNETETLNHIYFLNNGNEVYLRINNYYNVAHIYNLSTTDNTLTKVGTYEGISSFEEHYFVKQNALYAQKSDAVVKFDGEAQTTLHTIRNWMRSFEGEFNSKILFSVISDSSKLSGSSGDTTLVSLYETDGTAAGTQIISDRVEGAYDKIYTSIIRGNSVADHKGYLYFGKSHSGIGTEVFRYDGEKYSLVEDVIPGEDGLSNIYFYTFNDELYFTANPTADPQSLLLYKLTDNASTIELSSYADYNGNQVKDLDEPDLPNQKYDFNNGQFSVFTNEKKTKVELENGNYTVSVVPAAGWVTTNQQPVNISLPEHANKLLLFGQQPEQIKTEGKAVLISDPSRCSFTVGYSLNYTNTGSTVAHSQVKLVPDALFEIESISPEPNATSGDTLIWEFSNLNPQQAGKVLLQIKMPNFEHMGDTLSSTVIANFTATDNSSNFADTTALQQILTCSYDPNDIQAIPAGVGAKHLTLKNQELQYLIRFQNMGNDYALNIKVTNELQQEFDLSSFKVLGSSHTMYTTLKDNLVSFHFDQIMLPDDKTNEPESHGYILYSIKPKYNLPDSTVLNNEANIFFDFNPAVLTNTAFNTLVTKLPETEKNALSSKEDRQKDFTIYPNPAKEYIQVQWHTRMKAAPAFTLVNSLGQIVHAAKGSGAENDLISLPQLAKGIYLLRVSYNGYQLNKRVIIQ